jgi:hypothetical protein
MKELPEFNLESLNVNVAGKKPSFLTSINGYRAKVPGGWLVLICGNAGISGVAFYPDSNHQWDGGTKDGKAIG